MATRTVLLSVEQFVPGGTEEIADATVDLAPTAVLAIAGSVVLPEPIIGRPAGSTVGLEVTAPGWAWRLAIQTSRRTYERWVQVEAGAGEVALADLPEVDPKTLTSEPPAAAWTLALEQKADDTRAARACALRGFHVALADADTSPVDVAFLGDSWLAGYGATAYAKTLAQRVLAGLRDAYQPAGIAGGIGSTGVVNTAPGLAHPVTYSTATPGAAAGLTRSSLVMAQGQQVNLGFRGTGFDIVYTGGSGLLVYSLDGADYVYHDTAGDGTIVPGARIPVRGLTSGQHTLVLGCGGTVLIEDFVVYDGDATAGIRARAGGLAGTTAQQLAATPLWDDELERIGPALVVVGLLANDWMAGRSPAQTAGDLDVVLERIRAAAPATSVALLAYPQIAPRDPEWAPWSEFVDVLKAAADADPDALAIDLEPAFGPYDGTTRGGLMIGDTAHPSHGGHAAAARLILEALA